MHNTQFHDILDRFRDHVRTAPATPPTYACALCRDEGFVEAPNDRGEYRMTPCVCNPVIMRRRHEAIMERDETLGKHRTSRFETIRPTLGLRTAYAHTRAFAADPGGTLVLIGGPGVGKSHLAAAAAYAVCDRMQARFIEAVQLLDRIKATFGGQDEYGRTASDISRLYRTAPFLVLDDFGTEQRTAFAAETLFAIVSERYNAMRPTIITSNGRLGDFGARLASRLLDRDMATIAIVRGEDTRRMGLPRTQPWGKPTFDPRAASDEWCMLEDDAVICPTCGGRPCVGQCPRQMWPRDTGGGR